MAKKKLDSSINKEKLDLGQTLYALDTRNKGYYSGLSDDMKKKYAPLVLMRFMSSAQNQGGMHEYHIGIVNDVVNQNFWQFSKNHIEFQHMLLATCGIGTKQYHNWIPMAKGLRSDKLSVFLKSVHPTYSDAEIDLFLSINSREDIKDLTLSHALDDDEIDELLKQYDAKGHGKEEIE